MAWIRERLFAFSYASTPLAIVVFFLMFRNLSHRYTYVQMDNVNLFLCIQVYKESESFA